MVTKLINVIKDISLSLIITIWSHLFGEYHHVKEWSLIHHLIVNSTKAFLTSAIGLNLNFIRFLYNTGLQSSAKGCKTSYIIVPPKFRKSAHDIVKAESINRYEEYYFEELDTWEAAKDLQITSIIPNSWANQNIEKSLYFLHGGGFMMGHPKAYHGNLGDIAERANCQVWALNYRKTPEVCLPAIFEDLIAGYLYLTGDVAEGGLGISANNIVAGGDSAGGCMVAWLTHFLRDTGLNQVCGAFMWSPLLDLSTSQPAYYNKMSTDILPNHPKQIVYINDGFSLENTLDHYCYYGSNEEIKQKIIKNGGPVAPRSISGRDLYNPLGNSNFSNLPPVLIIAGEEEFLRDDGYLYAKKVFESNINEKSNASNIPAQILQIYHGMVHNFVIVPFAVTKDAANLRTANFVKLCLHPSSADSNSIREKISDINQDLSKDEFEAYYYKMNGDVEIYKPTYPTVKVPILVNKK